MLFSAEGLQSCTLVYISVSIIMAVTVILQYDVSFSHWQSDEHG